MKAKFARIAAAAAACLLSTAAFATPITLNGSLASGANGSLLSNGSYAGSFNGSAALPADYTINSLSFSFLFTDNKDEFALGTPVAGTTVYGDSSYNLWTGTLERTATTTSTVKATGKQESVQLSVGGVDFGTRQTASVTDTILGEAVKGNRYKDGQSCVWIFGWVCTDIYSTAYSATNTKVQDWTGTIAFDAVVTDRSIIDQLLQNDVLNFNLKVGGDLYLTNAQVKLDITETPKTPSNPVPEPSSLLLAAAGLAGLGYSRRRAARR